MPKATSRKQAALFGAIAGGQKKVKGFPPEEAKERLRGVKVNKLPAKRGKK